MLYEHKLAISDEMIDIFFASGKQIVETDHAMTLRNQRIAQMASDKPRSSRYEYGFNMLVVHGY